MSIVEFCKRNVVTATRDTSVAQAAQLMRRNHVGDVLVTESSDGAKRPVGIVTDRDIVVEVIAAGLDPAKVMLGDLLQTPLVTVSHLASYAETVHVMAHNGVRRMPVVNDAGLLVGIITLDDVLHQLAKPLAELALLSTRERTREIQTRR